MRGPRLAVWIAGGLLVALVAAMALATQLVRSNDHVQRWLGRTVGTLASTPDSTITIARIRGDLLSNVALDGIALADRAGTWATLDHLAVGWVFDDLFAGWLTLHQVQAGKLDLLRLPLPSTAPSHGGSPHLPIAVELGRLTVEQLALEAPVIGATATLSLSAAAQARPGWRDIAAELSVQRLDAPGGSLHVQVQRPGVDRGLVLAADYHEPAGGLLARLLAVPGLPAMSLKLDGAGPERDWRGRLAADAEGNARLEAALAVGLNDRLTVGLDGGAEITGLLPPNLQAALGRITTLSLQAERAADGTITVTHATVGAGLGTLSLSGRVQPTLDLTATATLSHLSLLSDQADTPLDGTLHVAVHATGDPAAPSLSTELTSDRLSAGSTTINGLATTITSAPPSSGPAATIMGSIARLETEDAPPLAPITWRIEADRAGDDRIAVSRLDIDSPLLTVGGTATLGLTDRQLAASLSLTAADLGLWQSLTGMKLAGRTTADVTIDGALDSGLNADIALRATDLVTHQPIADALLGRRLDGTLHAHRRADGTIELASIALQAADLRLHGSGTLTEGRARSTLQLDLPRLAPLGQALGAPLEGKAAATVEIDRTDAATGGQLRFDAQLNGVAARLSSRFALTPQRLAIEGLRLDAAGASLTGSAAMALPSGLVDGKFDLAAADLAGLSALTGTTLAGRLQGRLRLASTRATQNADLMLSAHQLKSGDAHVASASVTAALSDVTRAPRGRLTIGLTEAGSGGMTLARATVTADGAIDQLGWSIAAQGQARQRFTLDASGQASARGDTGRLTVQRLTGQFGTTPIRLEQATTLQRAADSLVLAPTRLDLGRGRLHIAASRRGAQLAGTLELQDLPLDLAHVIAPIKLDGRLDAQARMSGSLAAPEADLSVTVRHAMLAGNPVPIDGTISAGWHGRDGKLQARITGLGDRPLIASAAVPIAYRVEPFSLGLMPGGALDAHLAGPIDLRRALNAGGVDQPVSGHAVVDLTVAGTVGRPLVSGSATLTGGRYADAASGVTLDAIDARLVGDGSRLALASLSATDGAGGRLTGQGAVDLAAAAPVFEGSIALAGFVLHRDEGTATADAAVRFTGGAAGARLGGTVTIQKADLAIPDRLPVSLVNIPVTEINGGRPKPAEAAPTKSSLPIKLALTVTLPGQVLVRGRGLDSEWRGRLTIGGTADAPDILGTLSLVRGRLDFLGRALTLSDGKITFPGGAQLDPTIDLTATATTSDLTATIKLTGTANKPTLALSSDPPLPQDEILARVLFDKNLDQLSAAQAIQLAQAVATLTGGSGGGIVDRIRKATGLDVINVQSGQSDGTNATGSSLSVGKYIGNRVLVTGEQGLTPGSSRAGVEIGITNHLSAKTSVGADADSSLGLNWKLDY